MEVKTKAKKWGSSIAIILPKAIVEARKIHENDEIIVEIKKRPIAGEFFGKFPRKPKKSAQQLKDEARRGWD
jgi:antitoxin component of MazEF toxin-antitoxin module